MSCVDRDFQEVFNAVFGSGVTDIKFFINPEKKFTPEQIKAEAVRMMKHVNDCKYEEADFQ